MKKTIVFDPLLNTPKGKQEAEETLWNVINPKFRKAQEIINNELHINIDVQPTKLKTINNWDEGITYQCVTQTITFKDEMDKEKGLGFIYNMIEPKKLLVATVGIKSLNESHPGAYIKNKYTYIDLTDSKDSINKAILDLVSKFADCYGLKYKLSKDQCINLKMELLKGMI